MKNKIQDIKNLLGGLRDKYIQEEKDNRNYARRESRGGSSVHYTVLIARDVAKFSKQVAKDLDDVIKML